LAKGSRSAGGFAFQSPVEVSAPLQNNNFYDKPWVGLTAQGSIIVTYSNQTAIGDYDLVAARSADAGFTWTQSNIAHDPTMQMFRNLAFPCTTFAPGRFYVTYLNFPTASQELSVGVGYSDDDGVTWVDPSATPIVSAPGETVAFDDTTCASAGAD